MRGLASSHYFFVGGELRLKREPLSCCPHCGSTEGVFTRTTLFGVPWNLNFDGTPGYNADMYDNALRIRGGETVYCQSCGKVICRLSTWRKMLAWTQQAKGEGDV